MHRMSLWANAVALALGTSAWGLADLGPGDTLPPVEIRTPAGEDVPLSALLGSRGGLVVMWASWSPRSEEILSYLAGIHPSYAEHGLQVIPVAAESEGLGPGRLAELGELYESWHLPWPTYFDPELDLYAALGAMTVPTSAYLSEGRRLVGSYPGFPPEAREALPALVEKGLGVWAPEEEPAPPIRVAYHPANDAGPLFQMARLLFHRGQKRRALALLAEALEHDPGYALAQAAAAFVADRSGRPDRREAHLEALRQRVGSDPRWREALGLALVGVGRLGEAEDVLLPLAAAAEPRPRGVAALALIRWQRGDREGARAVLGKLDAWPVEGVPLRIDTGAFLDRSGEEPLARWREPVLHLLGFQPRALN